MQLQQHLNLGGQFPSIMACEHVQRKGNAVSSSPLLASCCHLTILRLLSNTQSIYCRYSKYIRLVSNTSMLMLNYTCCQHVHSTTCNQPVLHSAVQHDAIQKQIQMHDRPRLVTTLYSSLLVEAPLLGSAPHHSLQHGTTATVQHTAVLASLNKQCSVLWGRVKIKVSEHGVLAIMTVTCQRTIQKPEAYRS